MLKIMQAYSIPDTNVQGVNVMYSNNKAVVLTVSRW